MLHKADIAGQIAKTERHRNICADAFLLCNKDGGQMPDYVFSVVLYTVVTMVYQIEFRFFSGNRPENNTNDAYALYFWCL